MSRFRVSKYGIIQDTHTSLVWQSVPVAMSCLEAMEYAKTLELGGVDWRLPTIEELITLIDYSKHSPASQFPGMPPEWFWSSTAHAECPDDKWGVNFDYGVVTDNGNANIYTGHVLCVLKRIELLMLL
jgi:hypothetical protein